ncbi:MAG: capsular biosynthesis protein [Myxococcota bacterium]
MLRDVVGRRVLLLQGPNGPFFMRFAAELRSRGCEVTKVNFNSGDDLFYRGPERVRFNAPMDQWPDFLTRLIDERDLEVVFVYGDQRPIHRQAKRVAEARGLRFFALEEGYLRPDHVTIEVDGANANSPLPRDPAFYRRAGAELAELPPARPVGNTFRPHAWLTTFNAVAFTFLSYRYPHYEHHRDINAFKQAYWWTRAGYRKLKYQRIEQGMLAALCGPAAPPFYLVPLQVYVDSQLQHSSYGSVAEMIEDVVARFALHGRPTDRLVLKHHPHDRGYTDYTALVARLRRHHELGDRVVYIHDLHLPTLLRHCRGVITMNSTVGLSALYHRAPVKVLGRAVYDMPELTSQRSLAEFLDDPGEVDEDLVESFFRYLRHHCQINGSFYTRLPGFLPCGLDPRVFERGAD